MPSGIAAHRSDQFRPTILRRPPLHWRAARATGGARRPGATSRANDDTRPAFRIDDRGNLHFLIPPDLRGSDTRCAGRQSFLDAPPTGESADRGTVDESGETGRAVRPGLLHRRRGPRPSGRPNEPLRPTANPGEHDRRDDMSGYSGETDHRFRCGAGQRFRSNWTPVGATRERDYEPRWLVWVNARRVFRIDSLFKLSW